MDGQGPSRRRDPGRVRHQPALHTPKRLVWLVPGLLLAVAAVAAFVVSMPVNIALAWIGIAFVTASAIALVVAALTVADNRQRNLILAGLMSIMAAMSLVLLVAILWAGALPRV